AITAATTGASTAAASASTAPTASAPPLTLEDQRLTCPLRRGGGDIAPYAAAPGGPRGGRLGCHQSDQDDRRHVKQTLRHRCGLTPRVGSELLSSSRLLGQVSGFVEH